MSAFQEMHVNAKHPPKNMCRFLLMSVTRSVGVARYLRADNTKRDTLALERLELPATYFARDKEMQ